MKLGQDWAQNTITALLNRTHRSYRPWFRIQIAEGIGMFTRETENATQMSSDVLTWQRFWLHLQANLWRPLPTVVRSRPNVRDLDSTTLGLGPNHRVSPWWRFEPSPFVAGGHNASKKQTNKNWTSHNASTIAIHSRGVDTQDSQNMCYRFCFFFLLLHHHTHYVSVTYPTT